MLCSLPDDLLVHILSLLPLKTSVSTSILSRRWLHLWKHTTKLIFIDDDWSAEFVHRVNSVLKSHIAPSLQEFTVDLFANESHGHDLAQWLEFAFSRRVETFELNLHGWQFEYYYSALCLEEIITLLQLPTTSIMRSLKVLRLLEIKTNGDSIQFFLENCPLLEELVIRHAAITSDVELVGPSLRCLDVQQIRPRKKTFSIKVFTPNLTMLTIDVQRNRIFLENVPKLVHMFFHRDDGATMNDIAAAASQLENLTIFVDDPKEPFWIPEMPKLKKLVIDNCSEYPPYGYVPIAPFPVTSFLRELPCLQEFQVKFTKLALEEGETDQVPKESCGTIFRHLCLKRFKLFWFCDLSGRDDHIKLVRYVVESCVGLEEIEISRCDDLRTKLEQWKNNIVVDGDWVRIATTEERASFEITTQPQLPAHIKLRIANHYHV